MFSIYGQFLPLYWWLEPNKKRTFLLCLVAWLLISWLIKNFKPIIKQIFIRCRTLNISLAFTTQSYFSVPKAVRLNSAHYLIMKIHNKKELEQITINHSADIDYRDLWTFTEKVKVNPILFWLLILHCSRTTIL